MPETAGTKATAETPTPAIAGSPATVRTSGPKGMPATAGIPATAGLQATAVVQEAAVTQATSNSKDDSISMTARNIRNARYSKNENNNKNANTVWTLSKLYHRICSFAVYSSRQSRVSTECGFLTSVGTPNFCCILQNSANFAEFHVILTVKIRGIQRNRNFLPFLHTELHGDTQIPLWS
jgi:hypothetical protein